jgi:outer membrane protein assembly factor BamD (BamD/ComL family)
MKISLLLLFLAAIPTFGQAVDPAKVLFDVGTREEQAGRPERAKLALLTLASTYQSHPLADRAKVEIGAIYLFLEAQAQVQSGKTQDGYATFRTILRVYPESPLAKLADEAAKSLGIPADPRR